MDAAPTPAPAAAARPAAAPAEPDWGWLDGTLVLVVLALGFALASFPATNNDLWLHLAAGRLTAHGQLPSGPDPFSALDPPPVWVNHSWLTDVLLYALYAVAGGPALVIAKAVLVALLAGVLLLTRRPGTGMLLPAVGTALALLAMSPRLLLQSTVVSYLLFGVLLLLLNRRPRPGSRWRLPVAVGVLFLLWANLDGGFVLGLALLLVWLVGAVLQRAAPLGDEADAAEAGHGPEVLAVALAVGVVACVINPAHVRVFSLPAEFLQLTLPDAVLRDPFFEGTFRGPLSSDYPSRVGWPAALAYYVLVVLGLVSFAANAAGWRWGRALAWLAFAWLSSSYVRLVPYFAVAGGPVLVLNFQEFAARRRAARAAPLTPAAAHARNFLAGAARVLVFLVGVVLVALAWPGWLAADAGSAQQSRRVGFRLEPDPTMERLARQLADWYRAGRLRPAEDRGYFLQPEFAYFCAWFCPEAKGLFDYRFAAPADVTADYLKVRRELLALRGPAFSGEANPEEAVQELLHRYGITYLVLNGNPVLEGGLARALWNDPNRWPLWAIAGRGVVVGWNDPARPGRDPHADLRADPVRLAVGAGVERMPPYEEPPPPAVPSLIDRYVAAPPPVPPETHESGLWLAYHDALRLLAGRAMDAWKIATYFGRSAPPGVPDLTMDLVNARAALEPSWYRSPVGQAARAANLLAVRAARRAARANPDDYESYLRLAQAYGALDTVRTLGRLQQITAARQALVRLPIARTAGQFTGLDERNLQGLLYGLYQQTTVPGSDQPPIDLMLEAFERFTDLLPVVIGRATGALTSEQAEAARKQAEAEYKRLQEQVAKLRQEVKQRSDKYEIATAKFTPLQRAAVACRLGLAREAINVLRGSEGKDLNPEALDLMLNLFLIAGEAESARTVLHSPELTPLTRLDPRIQPRLRSLRIQTAAVLGDYGEGLEDLIEALKFTWEDAQKLAAMAVQAQLPPNLAPSAPLSQSLIAPFWGGPWRAGDEIWPGVLLAAINLLHQYEEWVVLRSMLALEQGDIELARQSFAQALQFISPAVELPARAVAQRWQDILDDARRPPHNR